MYSLNPDADARPTTVFSEHLDPANPAVEFRERLERLTPSVFVTPVILSFNIIVFVVMLISGAGLMNPTPASLIRWGADFGPNTISAGEWWRLLSAVFVHVGVIHLAFNMFVLMQIGPFVERLLGNLGFLMVYVICGVSASIVSLAWNPYLVSAGASGAIFGLYGALLGFITLRRDSIPEEVLSGLTKTALVFLGYNLVFGLLNTGTDLAAHVGGFIAGLACGLAMSGPLTDDYASRRSTRAMILSLAAAGLLTAAALELPRPADLRVELQKLPDVERTTLGAYQAAVNRVRTEKLGDNELAGLIERNVVPAWAAEHDSLAKVANQRLPAKQKELLSRLVRYMDERQAGWSMMIRGLRMHDIRAVQAANQKMFEAQRSLQSTGNAGPRR